MARPLVALGYVDEEDDGRTGGVVGGVVGSSLGGVDGGGAHLAVRRGGRADEASGGPVDRLPPIEQPLKAARTDDNADFTAFQTFLGTWTDRAGWDAVWQRLDVRDRGYVEVVDADGVPVPDVEVVVRAGGRVVHRSRTYGDGRAPVYPHLDVAGAGTGVATSVAVRDGDGWVERPWTGTGPLAVTLDDAVPATRAVPLDVTFVLDTTGSMSDELDRIKATLLTVTDRLGALDRPVDLRLGAVFYRDQGDDYVTRAVPLTSDVQHFVTDLRRVSAGGGGDTAESLNAGLRVAVDEMAWRPGAAHVAFLVADAPPHMDYADDVPYGTVAAHAVGRGVRIHTVAASGLDALGSLVFRQVAQLTQGEFIFIQYGSVASSAAAHGVKGEQLASNNLDQILYDRIAAEVDGWRR